MFSVDNFNDPSFGMVFNQRYNRSQLYTVEALTLLEVVWDYIQQEVCEINRVKVRNRRHEKSYFTKIIIE